MTFRNSSSLSHQWALSAAAPALVNKGITFCVSRVMLVGKMQGACQAVAKIGKVGAY